MWDRLASLLKVRVAVSNPVGTARVSSLAYYTFRSEGIPS